MRGSTQLTFGLFQEVYQLKHLQLHASFDYVHKYPQDVVESLQLAPQTKLLWAELYPK